MVSQSASPAYNREFDAQVGTQIMVAEGVGRITAPNASPYTFTGTNSFLVGHQRLALIDPGPENKAHEVALLTAIGERPVDAIILTHTHRDHSAAAASLAKRLGAPLWFGGRHRLSRPLRRFERNLIRRSSDWDLVPDRTLVDGETVMAGDIELIVHATPGHCANHLAFGIAGTDMLLTGDHVMGWNSTLVSTPDGSMTDYFASLDKLIALPYRRYFPAHGGPIEDGPAYATALRAHRRMRNRQIIEAVKAGARTPLAVVGRIYPQQPPKVRLAALMTINAHIEFLEEREEILVRRGILGTRLGVL
ncbi:MBL fold metallo-hydrolase [Devosia sp. FJ2-5-3]|uniref:MBL fold metallo-hydrolase n=1 Tax=Devosia sp. FJ2-5-3 TaxID=2976680 RepID=UPI0023D8C8BE|nr:MBL fold metallo-hydrolase [Devosia sp. FJ2-5-3]WEJ57665.1 MBL fold metallo-hydrolase [Devosia sp. FJ2-5-3]